MEGDRRPFVLYAALIYFLRGYGSCSVIVQGPSNVTVITGSNASFLCTVTAGWKSLSWNFNNVFVVTITPASGAVVDGDHIVVRNSTSAINGEFTSEMTIVNVNYSNSGAVQCSSLSSEPKEAFLSVQVNGSLQITNGSLTVKPNATINLACQFLKWYPMPRITWEINNTLASSSDYVVDYVTGKDGLVNGTSVLTIGPEDKVTVTCLASIEMLPKPQSTSVEIVVSENISGAKTDNTKIIIIAVTVSVGCLLLLIIIIVIILCCCKKKDKGTSYQSNPQKASIRSGEYVRTAGTSGNGESNLAYLPDPPPLPSVPPPPKRNNLFHSDTISNRTSTAQVSVQGQSDTISRKIRHITHV